MTLDEFKDRWRDYTIGVIVHGSADARQSLSGGLVSYEDTGKAFGGATRAADALLTRLYHALQDKPAPLAQLPRK